MWRAIARVMLVAVALGQAGFLAAAGDPNDAEGAQDPPLFTRMPGFHIYNAQVKEFDRYEFPVAPDKTTAVEGRLYTVIYYANDGITLPSALQIARNYKNAVKAIGGQAEIAKLLKAHPEMRLYVVGHTDNAGSFDHNLTLSKDRAQSVTNALVKTYGIAATRLRPFGVGPTAPVASNRSEEGRAKNRRVELVEQ
ncbi:MAG: hypothetical protein B7Z61_00790 [Acidobacteria bacterium 37-71-11]|nr:MAG: hypothetical protein B7Z61_00790 [Acidobacteria bacterium 37-71-11]HQT94667.1 OmpA family protein [Thermoanaerobaculaceae bacterium]